MPIKRDKKKKSLNVTKHDKTGWTELRTQNPGAVSPYKVPPKK